MHNHRRSLLFAAATLIALSVVTVTLFAQTEHETGTEEKIEAMASPTASQEVFEILTLDISLAEEVNFIKCTKLSRCRF